MLDETEGSTFKRHLELCLNLNMDKETADNAWSNYRTLRQNYSLEGDQLHWLACALYVSCRKTTTPTVGKSGTVEGNCVSLTRLLRLCKLSLIQFFNKSKKWADMTNMPVEFRSKIDKLERNFAVSMVIFKKFQPIFIDMFQNPAEDQSKHSKSRKQRTPCTPSKVFDFCWTLFICVKGEFPSISDDLVNSYHLLLACCDMLYANAVLADRKDILNHNFAGLPRNFFSPDYSPPTDPICIIDYLCHNHDGIPLEAKSIKEYHWKHDVKKLFDKKILKGDAATLSGILEPGNFEQNCKAVNKEYESYVLNVGDFDERIFLAECSRLQASGPDARSSHLISALYSDEKTGRPVLRDIKYQGDDANTDIGTPTKMRDLEDFTEKLNEKRNLNEQCRGMQQLAPPTPLTGRKYLTSKENQLNITPVSTATQSVSRLQSMVVGRQAAPSLVLLDIFKSCCSNPKEKIEERVREMGRQFYSHYTQQSDDQQLSHADFARNRLQLGEMLYYKLLENIMLEEKKRKPALTDFTSLLEQDIFHQTLFACSLEIVIYSYNSQRTFPWILDALNLEPYYFYKVIEVIIRVEDQLSRDMVKHLNRIEEQILESMAWHGESPLWESIKLSSLPVPSCEEVCLPGQLDESEGKYSGNTENTNPLHSPVTDRFQSPVSSYLAKKRVFSDANSQMKVIKPGQSLLQSAIAKSAALNIKNISGENVDKYIPMTYTQNTGGVIIQTRPVKSDIVEKEGEQGLEGSQKQVQSITGANHGATDKKPRRGGSIALFFRKFYHLASVRLQELCSQLEITEKEVRRMIWTCFEYAIVEHTSLMQDRHLDQLLMCSVYVICKVLKVDRNFTEIMRCYRLQPQAASHVYRSVLLISKAHRSCGSLSSNTASNTSSPVPSDTENRDDAKELIRSSSTLPLANPPSTPATPTKLMGTSSTFAFEEERGDLIKFYNTVYITKVQQFAMKFSTKPENLTLTLSPLPIGKNQLMSPCRRVSDKHSIFIRSLESKFVSNSPTQPLIYCFSRSPAKDLSAINNMIQVDSRKIGKRLLVDDINEEETPLKQQKLTLCSQKLQNLIGDRMEQNHN